MILFVAFVICPTLTTLYIIASLLGRAFRMIKFNYFTMGGGK